MVRRAGVYGNDHQNGQKKREREREKNLKKNRPFLSTNMEEISRQTVQAI
jgi:hypothetical protein